MQRGNWVPIDKGFLSLLPKDRPYSEIEAAFSLTCDYDDGKSATVEGYMKLWKWGKGKVYRFIKNRGFSIRRDNKRSPGLIVIDRTIDDTTCGRKTDAKRTQNGRPVIRDSRWLKRDPDAKRTQNGRQMIRHADDKQDTTIYPDPNPDPDPDPKDILVQNSSNSDNEKQNGKKTDLQSFWEQKPDWWSKGQWQEMIDHRRSVKAKISGRSGKLLLKGLEEARIHGETAESILDTLAEKNWKTYKWEWVSNVRKNEKTTSTKKIGGVSFDY